MLLKLSPIALILANTLAWLVIQIGLAGRVRHWPARASDNFLLRIRPWECCGRLYRSLGVRNWKAKLPDAAGWFDGTFVRRKVGGVSREHLFRFAAETRRAELVHWLALAALPIFAIWNSPAGFVVNALYALSANLPCIVVQRYNRARIRDRLCGR